jgi:hypothetical protein
MATHELPEWEGPSTGPTKPSIFRKPLPIAIPASTASTLDSARGLFTRGHVRNRSSFQAFDKETAVEASPATTTAPVPRGRRFRALSRRTWIIIAVVAALLLALIIGLAVGLSRKHSSKAQDLPLPTGEGIYTGDLTYYSPGPGYGACGYQNTSTEAICAVSHFLWDAEQTGSDPNANPLCGKHIRITRFDESVSANRSVDVEVVDRCVGCKPTDLDLSLEMFTSLADESLGRVVGSWAVS